MSVDHAGLIRRHKPEQRLQSLRYRKRADLHSFSDLDVRSESGVHRQHRKRKALNADKKQMHAEHAAQPAGRNQTSGARWVMASVLIQKFA
jgi:hypothetical protein